jgi:hypothetical protein
MKSFHKTTKIRFGLHGKGVHGAALATHTIRQDLHSHKTKEGRSAGGAIEGSFQRHGNDVKIPSGLSHLTIFLSIISCL